MTKWITREKPKIDRIADSNAVVEDLLRKIPNVTLWGDGQITVNGREVKSLLVTQMMSSQ